MMMFGRLIYHYLFLPRFSGWAVMSVSHSLTRLLFLFHRYKWSTGLKISPLFLNLEKLVVHASISIFLALSLASRSRAARGAGVRLRVGSPRVGRVDPSVWDVAVRPSLCWRCGPRVPLIVVVWCWTWGLPGGDVVFCVGV